MRKTVNRIPVNISMSFLEMGGGVVFVSLIVGFMFFNRVIGGLMKGEELPSHSCLHEANPRRYIGPSG